MSLTVGANTQVSLNFSLALKNGEIVDTNFGSPPVSFTVGDGKLLPAFENALFGLGAGQEAEFELCPEDAFGPHKDDNIQWFKKDSFVEFIDGDEELNIGLMIHFNDASGANVPGVVTEIEGDRVKIDFNHPLSGRDLIFKVRIDTVEPAQVKN